MIKSITTNNRGLLLIMQAKPRLKKPITIFADCAAVKRRIWLFFNVGFLILKINGNEDLEMSKNQEIAARVLKAVGGEGNVNSVVHCATRLRFKLKMRIKQIQLH